MKPRVIRPVIAAAMMASILSGCATTGGSVASNDADKCNPLAAGLAGAFVGALAGATKNRNGAAKGAIIGAAVGAMACLAVNASTRQTQTADTVEARYREKHGGRLPEAPKVLNYDTDITQGRTVAAGHPIEVKSKFAIVDGSVQKISSVREELVLLDSAGNEIRRAGKDLGDSSGGEHENTFSFSFPKGVSQGMYGIRTELLVNGEVVDRNTDNIQLVFVRQRLTGRVAMR